MVSTVSEMNSTRYTSRDRLVPAPAVRLAAGGRGAALEVVGMAAASYSLCERVVEHPVWMDTRSFGIVENAVRGKLLWKVLRMDM